MKERAFGLSGPEGNHGEDVKEYYFNLDNTPTHSYMKWLYKYPQAAFPYDDLVRTNAARTKRDPEYELLDTGVFDENRYWDVTVEYAKAAPDDILIRITAANRGPDAAALDILPTLWFRNTWGWGLDDKRGALRKGNGPPNIAVVEAARHNLPTMHLLCADAPPLLFTDNETNAKRLYGASENPSPHVKDAFHEFIVDGIEGAINGAQVGTKACARYSVTVDGGASMTVRLRLTDRLAAPDPFGAGFDAVLAARQAEADDFYAAVGSPELSEDARRFWKRIQ